MREPADHAQALKNSPSSRKRERGGGRSRTGNSAGNRVRSGADGAASRKPAPDWGTTSDPKAASDWGAAPVGNPSPEAGDRRKRTLVLIGLALLLALALFLIFFPPLRGQRMDFAVDPSCQQFAWADGVLFSLRGNQLTASRSKVLFDQTVDPKAEIFSFQGQAILAEPGRLQVLSPKKGEVRLERELDYVSLQSGPDQITVYGQDRVLFLNARLLPDQVQICQGQPYRAVRSPDGLGWVWLEKETVKPADQKEADQKKPASPSPLASAQADREAKERASQSGGSILLDPVMNRRASWEEAEAWTLCAMNDQLETPFRLGSSHHHFKQLAMPTASFAAALSEDGLWLLDLEGTVRLRSLPCFSGLDLAADGDRVYVLKAGSLATYDHSGKLLKEKPFDLKTGFFVKEGSSLYILGQSGQASGSQAGGPGDHNRASVGAQPKPVGHSAQAVQPTAQAVMSPRGFDRLFRQREDGQWEGKDPGPVLDLVLAGDRYALVKEDGVHPLEEFFTEE